MSKAEEHSIEALGLRVRKQERLAMAEHEALVQLMRETAKSTPKFTMAALGSFQTFDGDVSAFMKRVGDLLYYAVATGAIYDFGILTNDLVRRGSKDTRAKPISKLPWGENLAVFAASHPEEVPFLGSLSLYLVEQGLDRTIKVTEILFLAETNAFVVFASLHVKLPLGSSREVTVTAWTSEVSDGLANSILEPLFMAASFLRERAAGPSA